MENQQPKFLITDHIHPIAEPLLEKLGFEVHWQPDITNNAVLEIVQDYWGLMISTKTTIDKKLIDAAKNLKIVARVGSGMDHINQAYCREKNITCVSSPEGNCNAVAEHALGMLLALSNNLICANNEVKNGIWKRFENTGFELKNKTIGIIGYGHTGSTFAKKLQGFECDVLVYDKYKTIQSTNFIQQVDYKKLIKDSEIISFHLPYNKETHHWVDAPFIQSCGKNPIIINTSRGAILDTKALLKALEKKQIKGACIDVFEDEPLKDGKVNDYKLYEKIMQFSNVIVTPHIAGWTVESKEKLVTVLIDKIEETLSKVNK